MKTSTVLSVLRAHRGSLCVAACMVLSACGGGGGGGGAAPATQPAPPAVVPITPPPTPVIQTKPTMPIPAELWRAPADVVPKTGNYVYFSSEKGPGQPDFLGGGEDYLYSAEKRNFMYVTFVEGRVNVLVLGAVGTLWSGDIRPMNGLTPLQVGYYTDAQRYPFQSEGRNALSFYGPLPTACNSVSGWFAIDKIEYVNGQPSELDVRFEQHCEGKVPALHGQIHWVFDRTPPSLPGPIAAPAGLWKVDPANVPSSGNYFHMESDLGNYVGDYYLRPTSRLYTDLDSIIDINPDNPFANRLLLRIRGDQKWEGNFWTKASMPRLEVGYYDALPNLPTAERGGLDFRGDGRGTERGSSWFMIDKVVYAGDTLVAIDLRFAQRSIYGNNELRGQLHWSAAEKLPPPSPVYPPPAGLWQPPAASLPASGNYTYLQSDPGDHIGMGETYLYTPPRGEVSVYQRNWMPAAVEIRTGETSLLIGEFHPPENMSQLRPGYYAGLKEAINRNPAKGGLAWGGFARGCNAVTGWFVVDKVAYNAGVIVALDVRFEQHCEGMTPALRGAIHWVK